MTDRVPGLGLYSIGVRGLAVPDLLTWCATNDIPFLHLRGGRRGHDLAAVSDSVLDAWRTVADHTVPITMVTAEVILDDLLHDDPAVGEAARRHLRQTTAAAHRLGSRWVRVLTGELPSIHQINELAVPDLGLAVLLELHAPSWWTPPGIGVLDALAAAWPQATVLADSAQAQNAFAVHGEQASSAVVEITRRAAVVHLSDNGNGIVGPGHDIVARCARFTQASTCAPEVAFEWTGPDRTSDICLHRYRTALACWNDLRRESGDCE